MPEEVKTQAPKNSGWEPDRFSAPIPGESLTMPKGGAAWEHPPQFVDREKARQYLLDKMTDPRQVTKLTALLQSGMPAEAVANTVIKAGFMSGKWTPDLGLLLAQDTLMLVSAIGYRQGVKNMKIFAPDTDMDNFMGSLSDANPDLINRGEEPNAGAPMDALLSGDDLSEDKALGDTDGGTKAETKPQIGGLLGELRNA